MQATQEIISHLSDTQLRVALEIALSALSALIIAGGTFLFKRSKTYLESMDKRQERLESKVDKMATNCLPTIQANTGKANELLERLVESQAELNGFLKGRLK